MPVMRQLLRSLFFLSAALIPTFAYANGIDDFVLTGDGHTFRFSLPATGVAGVQNGQVRGFYFPPSTSVTVDGVGGYMSSALFRFDSFTFPRAEFDFSNPNLGSSFKYALYGSQLIGYTLPEQFGGLATVFYCHGSFDLATYDFNAGPIRTPFTLTITPEAFTSVTPEPATLALLATGSLGLLARLRRLRA